LLGVIAGPVAGGVGTKSGNGAVAGGVTGGILGFVARTLIDRPAVVEWDRAQEDEAHKMAFKVLLDSRYDVREIPKLYATLESLSSHDQRMTLGFVGERNRVRERRENADKLIQQLYKAEIAAGIGKGFIGIRKSQESDGRGDARQRNHGVLHRHVRSRAEKPGGCCSYSR
jgi:hypothetical protein